MTDQPTTAAEQFPHVPAQVLDIIDTFEDVIFETGGSDPRDLLNDYYRPSPNNLMKTNIVRLTLAVAVAAQAHLLLRLVQRSLIEEPDVQGKRSAAERGSGEAPQS